VTLQEADVFRVRRALSCNCSHRTDFVKLTRVPGDTRVRLQIGLEAEAVADAMSTIMRCVSAAEFGRISFA
jgi:hypothetical protein